MKKYPIYENYRDVKNYIDSILFRFFFFLYTIQLPTNTIYIYNPIVYIFSQSMKSQSIHIQSGLNSSICLVVYCMCSMYINLYTYCKKVRLTFLASLILFFTTVWTGLSACFQSSVFHVFIYPAWKVCKAWSEGMN